MKFAVRMAGVVVLGGLGIWLWLGLFPSPEQAVRKQVAALAATATLRPTDGAITRAGKVSSLIGLFATNADISYDLPGVGAGALSGRDEIREAAVGGFTRATALTVQFLDATVRVGADRQSAVVSCTARVSAGDSRDFGIQEMRFQFQKVDRDWLITRVETVKTLR